MRPGRTAAFAFASGFALLCAEVVWNRSLLLLTGGSADATMVVLSAVMTGFASGGLAFGRIGDSSKAPVRLLGLLSLACIPAFFMPLLLAPAVAGLLPALYSAGIPVVLVRAFAAFILVLPPSFLGGGLIPLLARTEESRGAVSGIAGLYALNTIGSALGGLAAGFVLLEALGARVSLLSASALMLASAILLLAGRDGGSVCERGRTEAQGGGPRLFHMVLFAASGMIALSFESVWSRQLTFVLGNSTYAFSAMGASALLGMGIGSWIGRRSRGPALPMFGAAVALEGLLGSLPLLDASLRLDPASLLPPPLPGPARVLLACFSMIPASACMGATFPFMVRAAARDTRLGRDVGLLTMANSAGAAAGPFFASLVVMSAAGPTRGTGILAALAGLTGAVAVLRGRGGGTWRALAAAAATAPAVIAAFVLQPPGSRSPSRDLDLLFFDEDRVATVSVFGRDWDGHRSLRINGVEEVPIDQASLEAFHLLGHLPWGYRPGARSVLVIALGGGITSGAVLCHPVESLVCVEICPSVVEALPLFAAENRRPDLDPRFVLVGDDGRNYLAAGLSRYDLIICDATHPGSSDSWVLYTSEFYRSVLGHLTPGGVSAQWVPLHQLPVHDLKRILATWSGVFPHCAVHIAGGRHAVLIGSNEPLSLDIPAMFDTPAAREELSTTAFDPADSLYLLPVAYGEEIVSAVSGSGVNTDDRAPCQFIRRRVPADPQATIAPCVASLLSAGGSDDPLREGQMLYWSGMLPRAVEAFERCRGTAMGARWLAVALTTASEGFRDRGDTQSALVMLRRAVAADSSWPRTRMLARVLELESQATDTF